jgi:hypothetical protein
VLVVKLMNRECYDGCMMEEIVKRLSLVKFGGDKGGCMFQLVDMGILGKGCMLGMDLAIVVVYATMTGL